MNFSNLPNDVYYNLSSYLSTTDFINLSQCCNSLRQFYGPVSWKSCLMVNTSKHTLEHMGQQALTQYTQSPQKPSVPFQSDFTDNRQRVITLDAVLNPEKYSWFHQDWVNVLACDFDLFYTHLATIDLGSYSNFAQSYSSLTKIDVPVTLESQMSKLHSLEFENIPLLKLLDAKIMINKSIKSCPFLPSSPSSDLTSDTPPQYELIPSGLTDTLMFQSTITHLSISNDLFLDSKMSSYSYGTHGLDELLINMNSPLGFNKVLTAFKQISRCDKLILVVPYDDLYGVRYMGVFKYFKNIPHATKEAVLMFRRVAVKAWHESNHTASFLTMPQLLNSNSNSNTNITSSSNTISTTTPVPKKLIFDKFTSIQDFPETNELLFEKISFPNLSDYSVVDNHNLIMSLSTLKAPIFFDSITSLSLDHKSWPLQYISKFHNLVKLKIDTTSCQTLHNNQQYIDTLNAIIDAPSADHFLTQLALIKRQFPHDVLKIVNHDTFSDLQSIALSIVNAFYSTEKAKTALLVDSADAGAATPLLSSCKHALLGPFTKASTYELFFLDCLFVGLQSLNKLQTLVIDSAICNEYISSRLSNLFENNKNRQSYSLDHVSLWIDKAQTCCSDLGSSSSSSSSSTLLPISNHVSSKTRISATSKQTTNYLCIDYFPNTRYI